MIRPWMDKAADWIWERIFAWYEAHPQHARTPEQQAEYERQGRLADERARIAWMERRRREREEDERGEETP
jgi:hypothetical protein